MPHQCTTCGHVFADGSKEMLSGCPDCGGNTFQFHPRGTEVPEGPPDGSEAGVSAPEPEASNAANTVGRAATKVRDFVGRDRSSGSSGVPNSGAGPPDADEPDAAAPWPDDLDGDAGDEAAGDRDAPDDAEIIDADARREAADDEGPEDLAQASARTDVAGPADVAGPGDAADTGTTDPDVDGTEDPDGADEFAWGATEDAVDPSVSGGATAGGVTTGGTTTDGATTDGVTDSDGGPAPSDGRVVSQPSGENPDITELREQLNDQFESIKIVEPGQYELNLMELFDREEYIIALQENGRYVIQVPENWLGDGSDD